MRVEVSDDRIEGFCQIPRWVGEQSVISFIKNNGKWTVGCSMALPSDIGQADVVMECTMLAYQAFKNKQVD